jgi:hypothetical protein
MNREEKGKTEQRMKQNIGKKIERGNRYENGRNREGYE